MSLVINRRIGERFVIQTPRGDVWLTVLSVTHGQVKLGIVGDRSIPITRPGKPIALKRGEKSCN